MKNIINWFKLSNRYKHLYTGLLIMLFYFILSYLLCDNIIISLILSTVSVFTHMLSVEYKDKLTRNKFDWYDILAGTILPIFISIVVWIIII